MNKLPRGQVVRIGAGWRRLALVIFLLSLLASGSDWCEAGAGRGRNPLAGQTFLSSQLLPGGLGPKGPEMIHWQIDFGDTTFEWMFTDVSMSGSYTYEDGIVTAFDVFGVPMLRGWLDPATGVLAWDSVRYLPVR